MFKYKRTEQVTEVFTISGNSVYQPLLFISIFKRDEIRELELFYRGLAYVVIEDITKCKENGILIAEIRYKLNEMYEKGIMTAEAHNDFESKIRIINFIKYEEKESEENEKITLCSN